MIKGGDTMGRKAKESKPKPKVFKGTAKPLVYGPVANPSAKKPDEGKPKKP